MTSSRASTILNAAFATVFITAVTGVILWIVASLAVAQAERAFELLGLLARSWELGHRSGVNLITGIIWLPIVGVVAVLTFRRFMATERELRNGGDV